MDAIGLITAHSLRDEAPEFGAHFRCEDFARLGLGARFAKAAGQFPLVRRDHLGVAGWFQTRQLTFHFLVELDIVADTFLEMIQWTGGKQHCEQRTSVDRRPQPPRRRPSRLPSPPL